MRLLWDAGVCAFVASAARLLNATAHGFTPSQAALGVLDPLAFSWALFRFLYLSCTKKMKHVMNSTNCPSSSGHYVIDGGADADFDDFDY